MKKVLYWIGVYTVCVTIDQFLDEFVTGLGQRLHRWSVQEPTDKKKKERRSFDMTTGEAGKVIDRIGF